jgi:hypothetical protein
MEEPAPMEAVQKTDSMKMVRLIVDPKIDPTAKWLARIVLLQQAGLDVTSKTLAALAGTTPEIALEALDSLKARGLVSPE